MNQQLARLDLEVRHALQTLIDIAAQSETADRRRTTAVPSIESQVGNPWADAADGYDCLSS
jgi:hypothetical protein